MAITAADQVLLDLAEGEYWWGGAVADGQRMPFGGGALQRNLATSAGLLTDDQDGANQSAPFLISNRGRYIWSEDAFSFEFVDGTERLSRFMSRQFKEERRDQKAMKAERKSKSANSASSDKK